MLDHPSEFLPPNLCDRPYSVSEVNRGVASMLEKARSVLWIEGEISNFKRASSGHCYFTLKDRQSQIPAVMWRSTALKLKFEPESGMSVMAIAVLRVYQRGGYYQLDIQRMQPAGLGALYAALEQLKNRLEKEGLFESVHKKTIPDTVRRMAVITSKKGAAVRDILKVVASRSPQTDVLLVDVPVQGDKAAKAIARAIEDCNRCEGIDCLIVGRGGGSIEDLWAFNEEVVARAIFSSDIPVISAVGHEIDFTIADFVADVRAPTPSAAAEAAVPDTHDNQRYYENLFTRFAYAFGTYWGNLRQRYRRVSLSAGLRRPARMLTEARQIQDDLRDRQFLALCNTLREYHLRLGKAAASLHALSPLQVLSRGYSVVTGPDGKAVRDANQLTSGDTVTMRFSKGNATGTITDTGADRVRKK